jgi:hypothetical protein
MQAAEAELVLSVKSRDVSRVNAALRGLLLTAWSVVNGGHLDGLESWRALLEYLTDAYEISEMVDQMIGPVEAAIVTLLQLPGPCMALEQVIEPVAGLAGIMFDLIGDHGIFDEALSVNCGPVKRMLLFLEHSGHSATVEYHVGMYATGLAVVRDPNVRRQLMRCLVEAMAYNAGVQCAAAEILSTDKVSFWEMTDSLVNSEMLEFQQALEPLHDAYHRDPGVDGEELETLYSRLALEKIIQVTGVRPCTRWGEELWLNFRKRHRADYIGHFWYKLAIEPQMAPGGRVEERDRLEFESEPFAA